MAEQSAVERLADQWNGTPDNSSTDYDCGRVDQRHDMTTQLLEAIEADRARAGVVAEEPEWKVEHAVLWDEKERRPAAFDRRVTPWVRVPEKAETDE